MAASRHTSQRITLLMLVLASVTILSLDYHGEASHAIGHVRNGVADALAPVQRGVAAVVHPLGDMAAATFHYGQVQTDNQRLRDELGVVSRQLAASEYAQRTEAQIATLTSLPFAGNIPSVPAEVISLPASNFEQTLEIDRGTSAGVGVGMPVVGSSGLVGSVLSAARSTAVVVLITDPHSPAIGVEEQSSGLLFQLQGQGATSPLRLSPYGSSSGTLKKGAYLETNGQTNGAPSAEFPAGIPVGRVASVHVAASGLQTSGSVTPLVDTTSLQYVAVLQWLPPA